MLKRVVNPTTTTRKDNGQVNVIKNENEELVADSNTILTRWKDYFIQLLNVHIDNDVGEI